VPLIVSPVGPGLVGGLWAAASAVGIIALLVALRYGGRLKIDETRAARWEAGFFLGAVAALLVLFLATLAWLPWNSGAAVSASDKTVTVTVTASQFAFNVDGGPIASGQVVELDAMATDVNHGLGVYDGNRLLFQVQMMPGYVNKYFWIFDHPGTYQLRCMEFCGNGHAFMVGKLEVAGA
jgi:cytochrome c oxidase subunit II